MKTTPNCPWCGEKMRFDADSAHVWFKCDSCLAASPKTERVWIDSMHCSENWAINERNASTTCMLLSPTESPRWISVEERLPKRYEHVLVSTRFTDEGEQDVEVAYLALDRWRKPDGPLFGKVTHWMPLPEAPKEE